MDDCFECIHHGVCIYFRTVNSFQGFFDTDAPLYGERHHGLYRAIAEACRHYKDKEAK